MPLFRNAPIDRNCGCDIFRLMQNRLFNYFILVSIISPLVEEIAARFRKGEKKGTDGASGSPRRPAAGGTGAPAEVSRDS
ncbi:hypothetical protein HJB78_11665 [Rhizobium lentis]|nr:hypothetical protein [Rhizobium lentis]